MDELEVPLFLETPKSPLQAVHCLGWQYIGPCAVDGSEIRLTGWRISWMCRIFLG